MNIDPLKDYRMIIYKIENINNGKIYIGQSTKSFYKRYVSGNIKKYGPIGIRYELEKYKEEDFSISILEHSVSSLDELNFLEKKYIKQFNSIHPFGYNFNSGGKQYLPSENTKKKQSNTRLKLLEKEYTLYHKDGSIYSFKNISTFAKEKGLKVQNLSNLINGKFKQYNGFYLDKSLIDQDIYYNCKLREVIGPNGEKYKFNNVAAFARKHNLIPFKLYHLLSGRLLQYQGFKIKSSRDKIKSGPKTGFCKLSDIYEMISFEKDNKIFDIYDIDKFIKENSLTNNKIYSLLRKLSYRSNGFRINYVVYTDNYLKENPNLVKKNFYPVCLDKEHLMKYKNYIISNGVEEILLDKNNYNEYRVKLGSNIYFLLNGKRKKVRGFFVIKEINL